MEQLRVVLEVVKKYHFWILCGLVVLISFGTWYWATADRADEYAKRKTKLDGEVNTVKTISNNLEHPSESSIRTVLDFADGPLKSSVTSANTRLFDEQRKSNPLPHVYSDPDEQAHFEDAFTTVWNHKIEEIEKPPQGRPMNPDAYTLDVTYRNQYRERIKEHFPELFKMIDRRTAVKSETEPGGDSRKVGLPGFGARGGDDHAKQYTGIVDWHDAEKLIDRFRNWNDTPTTLQVMLAQEELWVYEALLKVIRNTNDNSKGKENDKTPLTHKTARIKEILALEIGNEAVLSWTGREGESAVIILPAEGAAADAHAPPAKAPPPAAMTSRPTASYLDKSGATGSPLVGRYVDNNGKPLEDPSQQPNQEFRMMPIDLRLIIEQKAIPRLLAECANSSMRIDVRSVRILAEKPPAFDITSSNNPAPAGMPGGMGRGFGGRDMFSGGMSAPARAGRTDSGDANSEEESADSVYPPVLVEIQGIIYIYNQPTTGNQGEGGVNAAAAATPAGTASPAAPVNPQPGVTPGKAPAGTGAPAPVVPGTNPLPAARGPGAPGTAAPPVPPTRGVRP